MQRLPHARRAHQRALFEERGFDLRLRQPALPRPAGEVRRAVDLRLEAADVAAHVGQRGGFDIVEMMARQPEGEHLRPIECGLHQG